MTQLDRALNVILIGEDLHTTKWLYQKQTGDTTSLLTLTQVPHLPAALELLNITLFDVVVCESSLLQADPPSFLNQLWQQAAHLPVIVLVPPEYEHTALSLLQHGVQDYIVSNESLAHTFALTIHKAYLRQHYLDHLLDLALVDELTGLYNRRGFRSLAQHLLTIAARTQQPLTLFFLDQDNLKAINDRWGHEAGNLALQSIAAVIRTTFRKSDVCARFGGDEFVVVVLNTNNIITQQLMTRFQANLLRWNKDNPQPYLLSVSIGWMHYDPYTPLSLDALLHYADVHMYQNKRVKKRSTPSS